MWFHVKVAAKVLYNHWTILSEYLTLNVKWYAYNRKIFFIWQTWSEKADDPKKVVPLVSDRNHSPPHISGQAPAPLPPPFPSSNFPHLKCLSASSSRFRVRVTPCLLSLLLLTTIPHNLPPSLSVVRLSYWITRSFWTQRTISFSFQLLPIPNS